MAEPVMPDHIHQMILRFFLADNLTELHECKDKFSACSE
jgi:hypothetical protein